jgi:hypothetical protein
LLQACFYGADSVPDGHLFEYHMISIG